MSSHRFDRVRRSRVFEKQPSFHDASSSQPQVTSIAKSPVVGPPRSNIPTPLSASVRRGSESRSNAGENEQLVIHPLAKTSRSMSSDDARPTGLPRSNGNPSSLRRPSAPSIFATRSTPSPGPATFAIPTASSGKIETVGNMRERPRNVLRRKANFRKPSIDTNQAMEQSQTGPKVSANISSTSLSIHEAQPAHGMGIMTPVSNDVPSSEKSYIPSTKLPKMKIPKPVEQPPLQQIPKEFIGLRTVVNTSNLPPPPTPIYAPSASPSTRYSDSPGMWSSRGSTPTSLSSYSPGITQPATGYRYKQSPTQTRQPALSRSTTTPVSQTEVDEPTFLGPIAADPYARLGHVKVGIVENNIKDTVLPRSPPPRKSSMKFRQPQESDSEDSNKQATVDYSQAVDDTEVALSNADVVPDAKPSTDSSPVRPRRPSRQGTDRLEQAVSPIIRSNLTTLRTTGHTRRESSEKLVSPERLRGMPVGSAATSVESFQSSFSTRIPSRSQSPSQIPKRSARTLVKSPRPQNETTDANTGRKFGLFSKKSKPNLSSSKGDSTDKSSRKGPAAGTGHEGYGKYANRGRKPSVGSNGGPRARSTSTSGGRSIGSGKGGSRQEPDIDSFFLDRLEPVVINGGGMDREELFRTQSGQSISSLSVTSAPDSSTMSTGTIMNGYSSESLGTSTELTKPTTPSLSSESNFPSQPERLHGSKPLIPRNDSSSSLLPTMVGRRRGSNDTRTGSEDSKDANFSALPLIAKTSSKSTPAPSTKKPVSKVSRKWNFFHRSQKSDQKDSTAEASEPTEAQLHAKIAILPNSRPVAHYALLDADSDTLEDILIQVEDSPLSDDDSFLHGDAKPDPNLQARHGTSILLPSPPALWSEFTDSKASPLQSRPASPKVFFRKDDQNGQAESGRPSRLASVGRIPQVVSRQDRDHKPSSQSYSRPFCRDGAPSFYTTTGTNPHDQHPVYRPQLDLQTEFHGKIFNSDSTTPKPASAPVVSETAKFASSAYAVNEFLQFPPRKQSQVSSSTSEADSIMAVVASIGPRLDTACEEDIWTEYDDLLDTVLTVDKGTAGNKEVNEPFEMVTKASKTLQAELNALDDKPRVSVASDTLSIPVSESSAQLSDASVRLRRSKIATALHTSLSPSPQVSYSDLIAGYAERNKSGNDLTLPDNPGVPPNSEDQTDEPRSPTPTRTDFETTRRRNTMLFDMAERDREGAAAQTNLRSASLMTSRWLSFGRVLFSPAHNRIKETEAERILIIDGLGNDDWSYYCALTYPNATIYSLSIRPEPPSSSPHPDAWKPPVNHHLVHHPSASAAFPFPKNFFAVCILRFPPAYSEDGQRNVVSECKRVLRPGGYIEMSVIDLDLVNVGNRARKAVRTLKEKVFLADPTISLKPASDNIQRLLGICGYDNLNRCMVSIPVAGMIGGSSDSSRSNRSVFDQSSSSHTQSPSQPPSTTSSSQPHTRTPSDDAELSLGDLLSDPSPSASNDESITKMVARVGRWWYTRCYEIPVLVDPSTDRSIWAEQKLLRECQKQGTGFRLLIAYAQKPSEKRRTVSV
ncbi:hypothetical protein BGW36DRAFT_357439 [Talaromyces proteolyticus]|uniref:Methyltransferase type 11 domain-containing protein n=1 Tax=Talaromyces proteolyticus TaxID=1131652 RepID=A0AAD4KVK9_9EURO|nr:uncharacterized protein BGW36DRAFT_357439 [Talaromyces proteolyticus]KAH8700795.1 hypothetical protein BGW36DRAFT_357439 [Talaromyces proteolyticus]